MSPEQAEQARRCETSEERMAFISDNDIDLTDEQMDAIAGGLFEKDKDSICPRSTNKRHVWENTGNTRPHKIFRTFLPDLEKRCINCGMLKWF